MTTFTADEFRVLDPGVYPATFDGLENTPEPGPYGPTVDFRFIVDTAEGPIEVSGRASRPERFTRSTKARQWVEALVGRPLVRDEAVDMTTLVGTSVLLTLIVKQTDQGDFNRVVGIKRVETGSVPVPQPAPTPRVDREYQAWLAEREAERPTVTDDEEPPSPTDPPADLADDDEG